MTTTLSIKNARNEYRKLHSTVETDKDNRRTRVWRAGCPSFRAWARKLVITERKPVGQLAVVMGARA